MMETWADIAKADKLLDWQPAVAVEDGLNRTIDWYEANRDWLMDVPV